MKRCRVSAPIFWNGRLGTGCAIRVSSGCCCRWALQVTHEPMTSAVIRFMPGHQRAWRAKDFVFSMPRWRCRNIDSRIDSGTIIRLLCSKIPSASMILEATHAVICHDDDLARKPSRRYWRTRDISGQTAVCAEFSQSCGAHWQFIEQWVNAHVNVRTHLKMTQHRLLLQTDSLYTVTNHLQAHVTQVIPINRLSDVIGPSFRPCVDYTNYTVHPIIRVDIVVRWLHWTHNNVKRVITSSASISCALDLLPTTVFKEFLPELLPFLTDLCNASLTEGSLPVTQRHAIVFPRVKKAGADPADVCNYQPISHLHFMSKVVEILVCRQLMAFLDCHRLLPDLQSAYRAQHSTETAVLKIVSDILRAADSDSTWLVRHVCRLRYVDHSILIDRLNTSFGIHGAVLSWTQSFITGRTQAVPGWWWSVCHFERSSRQCAGSSVIFTVQGWCVQYYPETWIGWPFLHWWLVDLSPSGPCFMSCPVTNCHCVHWWH